MDNCTFLILIMDNCTFLIFKSNPPGFCDQIKNYIHMYAAYTAMFSTFCDDSVIKILNKNFKNVQFTLKIMQNKDLGFILKAIITIILIKKLF